MGVGNFPAVKVSVQLFSNRSVMRLTLGQTWTQKPRDLLNKSIRGDEGVVFTGELLDKLFVFVELLQVICGHCIDTTVLGSIDVMLVSQDTLFHTNLSASFL